MEPNKVDKKFKKALQEREIAPTPAAWDRLDAMLTVAEEKKAAPTYNWLYIAATITGFIAIAIVFLSKTQSLVDVQRDDIVYEAPVQNKDSIQNKKQNNLDASKPSETVAETSQHNQSNQQPKSNQTNLKTNPIEEKLINQNPIVNQPNYNQPTIINQKMEQTNQLSNQIQITKEHLIATIESNPKLGKTPIKVSASNLLSEVDGELELSFREKVINKIDKNYKTVKVALANRNNQSTINQ